MTTTKEKMNQINRLKLAIHAPSPDAQYIDSLIRIIESEHAALLAVAEAAKACDDAGLFDAKTSETCKIHYSNRIAMRQAISNLNSIKG